MDRERVLPGKTLRTARALAAAVMLAAVAGCDGPGIFYTLATESPRSNRNLPDEATVTAVVSAGSHYYVAAGGMWRRAHAGDTWQPVTRPARGGSGAEPQLLVLGLAAAGDTLCAGTERGVYRAAAGESPGWRPVPGVPDTEQVLRVFAIPRAVETEILVVTQPREDEPVYRVYRSDDCRVFEPVSGLRDTSGLPYDATYAFGAYWVTVGDRLFRGAALDDLEAAAAQPEGSSRLRGVLLNDAGNRLYVADESGGIHRSEDQGGSWDPARIEPPMEDAEAVPLTLFTQIAGTILIGTKGFGFYQFEDGAPERAQRGPRITSQLYEAHITGFAQFEHLAGGSRTRIVFAGTAVAGLSSLVIDKVDGNFGTWNWE